MKLTVRAVPDGGFWRCGTFWPHKGMQVDASAFSPEDLKRLQNEKLLVVDVEAPVKGKDTPVGDDAVQGEKQKPKKKQGK